MSFVLPKPHPQLLESARRTYRLAIQYRHRVDEKWEPREKELDKADEFSRISIARENDNYRAERLVDYTRAIYLMATVGSWEWPDWLTHGNFGRFIEESRNRDLLRARSAIEETRILFNKAKRKRRS